VEIAIISDTHVPTARAGCRSDGQFDFELIVLD
jgi:hypothetical protein